jgi:hypothetical protein
MLGVKKCASRRMSKGPHGEKRPADTNFKLSHYPPACPFMDWPASVYVMPCGVFWPIRPVST